MSRRRAPEPEALTGDDLLKHKLSQIKDPKEALRAVVENSWCLGGDPYYNDLVEAILAMAERCGRPYPEALLPGEGSHRSVLRNQLAILGALQQLMLQLRDHEQADALKGRIRTTEEYLALSELRRAKA